MKKLTMSDNSIVETELGFDQINGWSFPSNVKEAEFENGTIIQNDDYDPDFKLQKIV